MTDRLSPIEQRIEWTRGFRCPTDKAVLKAMARWFCWRADGRNVRFTVAELARKAGVAKRSTERALERLVADWWIEAARIRGSRRPTTYRIVLERLVSADPDALRVADDVEDHPPEWRMNEADNRHSGGRETSGGRENRNDFEKVADQRSEGEVRTAPRTSTSTTSEEVRHFLAWAAMIYPQHASGAHLVVDPQRDGVIVHELLARYGRERLEAIAVQGWTIEADADPNSHASWIARSDRSLRVLRHKAAFLDRVVVGAQQLTLPPMVTFTAQELADARRALSFVYGSCPHNPGHDDWRECVLAIALARRAG